MEIEGITLKKEEGSITVFYSLTLLMTLVLFFTFLDTARLVGQKIKSEVISREAVMSCFGEYLRPLWDTYGVLALDSCYGGEGTVDLSLMEAVMGEYLEENANPCLAGENYYRLGVKKCAIGEYGLITDQGGLPFLKEAALRQKEELPQQALDALTKQKDQVEKDREDTGNVDHMIEKGQKAVKQAKEEKEKQAEKEKREKDAGKEKKKNSTGTRSRKKGGTTEEEPAENPMDRVMDWKDSTILSQVIPSEETISTEVLGLKEPVSKRPLAKGNTSEEGFSAVERALFTDYEMTHFQHYGRDFGHVGLQYEWEYVICGKKSDKANLAAVVEKLLVMREAENLISLRRDPAKMAEVESLALALVGWTGNPAIIEATKAGLMASWSYVESVLDVRTLLSGKKVALLKTPAQWTSQLLCLANYFPVSVKAKECSEGIDYEEYLCIMSALQTQKSLGLRSLDLMENVLHLQEGYKNVTMDRCVYRMKVQFAYESQPIFYSQLSGIRNRFPICHFKGIGQINYLTT